MIRPLAIGGIRQPAKLYPFVATEGLMRFLSLRAMFLLGFVVAMPVLALPNVARRIDELLYGAPPTDFGRAPNAAPPTQELIPSQAVGHVSPARFDEPSPAAVGVVPAAFESAASPPPLAPAPQFAPPSPPAAAAISAAPEPKIDERTIVRLQQIRQRLEQLGAEYVIVETQDGGRFRFHCRMLLDQHSRFTRPFEAASFDCLAAGEQVLREVEAWRTAGSNPQANLPQ
jgi:hypothetical protein